ncbi:hypothetical protein [Haloarcula amylovorans]|uniref:hypothetical protein n=1 Tax=Haloarcula amylovorans TaxID=2562280 RepID=UPI001075F9CE|nr:hypothetical protein [Halomicroarcula amylolytica]
MSTRDPLSAHVRILEATAQLNRATATLDDEDNELAAVLDELTDEVAAIGSLLEASNADARAKRYESDSRW